MARSSRLKKLKNAKKVKRGPTDRRTDIAGCRVAKHATKKRKKIEKIHIKNYKWKMTNGKLAVTDIHSHAYSLCLLKTDSLLLNLDSSKKLKLLKMLILFSEIRRSKWLGESH